MAHGIFSMASRLLMRLASLFSSLSADTTCISLTSICLVGSKSRIFLALGAILSSARNTLTRPLQLLQLLFSGSISIWNRITTTVMAAFLTLILMLLFSSRSMLRSTLTLSPALALLLPLFRCVLASIIGLPSVQWLVAFRLLLLRTVSAIMSRLASKLRPFLLLLKTRLMSPTVAA